MSDVLEPEDAKLVALARGARGRIGAANGAAVRDETGRTYSGADVRLSSLDLSALALAVAQAVAAGARGLEAAAMVGSEPTEADLAIVRDVAVAGVPVLVCGSDGIVHARLTS
jgi:hypothetical protein